MSTVRTGNKFMVYDEDMETYDKLPAQVYGVRFNPQQGFSLELHTPITVSESHIYGVHPDKVKKVINAFKKVNRNLGVILSGDKGIGKSLTAKLIAIRAIEEGYPVIIVDEYYKGLNHFLESINEEVVILLDEFDKVFKEKELQEDMLSMFDGMTMGKKLFVLTCNDVNSLSRYMLNRPGRFHYHFKFNYPTSAEVREYLEDNVEEKYKKEINNVVKFAHRTDCNYDCLRAIAFELNTGLSFNEAIQDLNIEACAMQYNVTVTTNDNVKYTLPGCSINIFSKYKAGGWCNARNRVIGLYIGFNSEDIIFNEETGVEYVPIDKVSWHFDKEDFDYASKDEIEYVKNIGIKSVELQRVKKDISKNIRI